jgi:serine/threonine-protein kinase RsbW
MANQESTMTDETDGPCRTGEPAPERLRAPRRVDALGEIFEFCRKFCAAHAIDADAQGRADFVLEEIFTNFVKYNAAGQGEIEIELGCDGDLFAIALTDFDTDRFDLRERREVDTGAPLEARTPGGLGIHLVKKFAKRIDYDYIDRRGRVTIYLELG